MKYKIGYIDEDASQVTRYERKLREYFDVVGYNIAKGLQLECLVKSVYESNVDLVMVDYLMVDKGILTFNGDEFIREYEKIKPQFPMIIFTNEQAQARPQVDNPNIIYDKNLVLTNLTYLVEIITKNIELYKNYVKSKKDLIEALLTKSKNSILDSGEKSNLIEAQFELRSLDKWNTEAPYHLLIESALNKVEDIRIEAENFLKSLKEKSK